MLTQCRARSRAGIAASNIIELLTNKESGAPRTGQRIVYLFSKEIEWHFGVKSTEYRVQRGKKAAFWRNKTVRRPLKALVAVLQNRLI